MGRTLTEVEVDPVDPILFSLASFHADLQEATQSWTVLWTTERRETFQSYLGRMPRYAPMVEAELIARELPASLRYLPLVESGYAPEAMSGVGASGLWQLMSPTARGLGLTVSPVVDERRDPVASTMAALTYLERLHDEFGSWLLALAAYNGGPGRIRRALDREVSGNPVSGDERFLEIHSQLPRETQEFVPRFLAAASLAERAEANGFEMVDTDPLVFEEVAVPDATSLDVVAEAAQVSEERVRLLNPHYVRGHTPSGEERAVRVPPGSADVFEFNFPSIPPSERLNLLEHVVTAGETFTHIASRYGIALLDLTEANRGVDSRRLQIGTTVVVPRSGGERASR